MNLGLSFAVRRSEIYHSIIGFIIHDLVKPLLFSFIPATPGSLACRSKACYHSLYYRNSTYQHYRLKRAHLTLTCIFGNHCFLDPSNLAELVQCPTSSNLKTAPLCLHFYFMWGFTWLLAFHLTAVMSSTSLPLKINFHGRQSGLY